MQNSIQTWHELLGNSGWEETGWNLFTNPEYLRFSILLYPSESRIPSSQLTGDRWEIRIDDKPLVRGTSEHSILESVEGLANGLIGYRPNKKHKITDKDKEWLKGLGISASFISIPLGQLSPPHTKVAISVPELVAQTNAFSVKRRPGCTPQLTKSDPKQLYLQYNVKCHESYSDPKGHDVRVKFDVSKVQETQKAQDLDVQLNCSCPAFLYWGAQWNLHQRDGLLGEPRPELVAPTQRLDLRSNFVICKHCKAVLERILPSVQHNMINIIREETVRKNKEKEKPTPEKLQKEQDAMKRRMELKKIREIKNKKIQERLLEALRVREEGEQPEEVGEEEAPTVVEREEPATEQVAPVVQTPKTEDIQAEEPKPDKDDITGMVEQEEKRLQQEEHSKLKNQPHLHKGLPYETDTEKQEHGHNVPSDKDLVKVLKEKKQNHTNKVKDLVNKKMKRKQTSLENLLLAAVVESER